MGSDFPNRSHLRMFHVFQSTLPGWGATIFPDNMRYLGGISIHAPRMGSDRRRFHRHQHGNHFNPRSPDGERRGGCHALLFHLVFQSTLPGWGATQLQRGQAVPIRISIHAPRMGSDYLVGYLRFLLYISIHAPRMGSDLNVKITDAPTIYFNPRSPDGERPLRLAPECHRYHYFNPRSPDGERHISIMAITRCIRISIHAPRMGSDTVILRHQLIKTYFNPRSPDGERPRKWTSSPTIWAKSSIFNTDCIADRR